MEAHEYANLFPMMEKKEFNELKTDIKQNGLMDEIITYESKILDGRNRFKACIELGITPKLRQYEGDNPLQYIISTNLKRRHLTPSQRAMVARRSLPLFKIWAKRRQGMRTDIVELIPPSEEQGKARDKIVFMLL